MQNKKQSFTALLRESGLIAPVKPLMLAKSPKDRDFNFSVFFIEKY